MPSPTHPPTDTGAIGAERSVLEGLLARVETASGPNFELECAIFEAFGLPSEWFGSKVESHFRIGASYGFNTEDGYRHLDCVKAPAYTASLDAALALCERVLPEANTIGFERGPKGCEGFVSRNYVRDGHWLFEAEAKTPALALLSAMLRALIVQAPSPATTPTGVLETSLIGEGSSVAESARTGP